MKTATSILFLASMTLISSGCNQKSKSVLDHSNQISTEDPMDMERQIATFFTFQNEDAEQAMNFYIELFDNSKIVDLQRWGTGEPGKEGTIKHATFELNGSRYMCSDSPPIHEWGFTPAVSNFVAVSYTHLTLPTTPYV